MTITIAEPFKGYKTHMGALLAIALILLENLLGVDVPGFAPSEDWLMQVNQFVLAMTLRLGIGSPKQTSPNVGDEKKETTNGRPL